MRALRGASSGEFRRLEMPQLSLGTTGGTPSWVQPAAPPGDNPAAEITVAATEEEISFKSGVRPNAAPARRSSGTLIAMVVLAVLALGGVAVAVLALRRGGPAASSPPATTEPTAATSSQPPASAPPVPVPSPSSTAATTATAASADIETSAAPSTSRSQTGVQPPPRVPVFVPRQTGVAQPTAQPSIATAQPTSTAAPTTTATASATSRARQQIDPSNPYSH